MGGLAGGHFALVVVQMKGHRKLQPGEVIREGDVAKAILVDGVWSIEPEYVGHPARVARLEVLRKARTDGLPQGLRWADAQEESSKVFYLHHEDQKLYEQLPLAVDQDSGPGLGAYCLVMDYPEDKRLEEE